MDSSWIHYGFIMDSSESWIHLGIEARTETWNRGKESRQDPKVRKLKGEETHEQLAL